MSLLRMKQLICIVSTDNKLMSYGRGKVN